MKFLPLVLAFLFLPVFAQAQDVTVNLPVWNGSGPPPDEMPKRRWFASPDYPKEMRRIDRIGYAIVFEHIDAEGHGNRLVKASEFAFLRGSHWETDFRQWHPARRAGRPDRADIWQAVIYNPAGSAPDKPDAGPRLLQVTPVWVSGALRAAAGNHPAIPANLEIDREGRVQGVVLGSGADEAFLPAIRDSLNGWQFAPARRNGQPVSSKLALSLVVAYSLAFEAGPTRSPEVVKRVGAIFPRDMSENQLQGQVSIAVDVGLDGVPRNPTIVRSNNPGFDQAALDAVQDWRFTPALKDGKPVVERTVVNFGFGYRHGGGQDPYSVDGGDVSKLPKQFQYDTAPRIRGTVVPVYPYDLLLTGKRGNARVRFVVGPHGSVLRTMVDNATFPEFGLALAAAVQAFVFDPALKEGKPTETVLKEDWEFGFHNRAADQPEDTVVNDYTFLNHYRAHPEEVVGAGNLDKPLRPNSRRPPIFPPDLMPKTDRGEATVEFLIDRDGHARVPHFVAATDPEFGYAAVQAIAYWRFDPPMAHGKRVVTRVQIPIQFNLHPRPR